ncbi:MAG: type IV secretory system conjugative DNA transfer family protein, partial [Burkholderiales bacterium]
MSLDHFFRQLDARYRIPRPANALHLDAYQAAFRVLRDAGGGMILFACGLLTAFLLWKIADVLQAGFETRLFFICGMILAALISLAEALSLALPYYRISQRLTHGSARWADMPALKTLGLAHDVRRRLPRGALRLPRRYDLALPFEKVLCHVALFGPPGSGKSSSFIMAMARDWARCGSAIFLDPKGELFKHTARHFRRVYRLDLAEPWFSDRWNFVPACAGDAELAHEIASI